MHMVGQKEVYRDRVTKNKEDKRRLPLEVRENGGGKR